MSEIATSHGYTGELTLPFKRFISERLRIVNAEKPRRKIEDKHEAKRMLELLKTNGDFFRDSIDLQNYFSRYVSHAMPLNGTWNPLLTQQYNIKGSEGLWYVYSNNKRDEYVRLMKQQMTSEWTGFNRFTDEPWDKIKSIVNKGGNLLDVGSSIGVSAVEIARALQMEGAIILLDYHNPLRNASSLRIVDYANPDRRLIPLGEVLHRMDELRGNQVLITLYGVDFSESLNSEIQTLIQDSAFVHCGNILPYLTPVKLYKVIKNAVVVTNPNEGIVKFHNDFSLPCDNILYSITLQRHGDKVQVIPDTVKGRF